MNVRVVPEKYTEIRQQNTPFLLAENLFPANSKDQKVALDLSSICTPYDATRGYPLISESLAQYNHKIEIEKVTVGTLQKMGLSFYKAWNPKEQKDLVNLLNLPEFRRLLEVGQMQIYFAERGKNHTTNRYVHSLFVAEKVFETIKLINKNSKTGDDFKALTKSEIKNCLIAALLHDYGHGPFSHIFEKQSHAFKIPKFDHDKEFNNKISQNEKLVELINKLSDGKEAVFSVLSKNDGLYKLVKVFGDRIAYLLTDGYSSAWGRDIHFRISDTVSRLQNSCRILRDNNEIKFVFFENSKEDLEYLYGKCKEKQFKRYCITQDSGLVAAHLGRAIKLYTGSKVKEKFPELPEFTTLKAVDVSNNQELTNFLKELSQKLSTMTDEQFIKELASVEDANPRLKEIFLPENPNTKIDDFYYQVLDLKYNEIIDDLKVDPKTLESTEFRSELRAFLGSKLGIPRDDIYAAHPIGDDISYEEFSILDSNSNIQKTKFGYEIKPVHKHLSIFIAKEHIQGETNDSISLSKLARVYKEIETFISDYCKIL
jgi:hypothetical protein